MRVRAATPALLLVAMGAQSSRAWAQAPVANARPPIADRPLVTLTLAEPSPVIGLTGETVLTIEVTGVATPLPVPRVLCSTGQIEDLGREGPAKFSARYILPTGRYPQPAILVAEFPVGRWPLRGMTSVGLRAAATPSFRTDPGARVTLRVADHDFGPRTAAADGMVHIPVVVPPGVGFAVARSESQHGSATEQVVDLHVPYAQRLLLVPPESLAAGAVGEVAVYAVDASGRPASGADLVLRAGRRKVESLGSERAGEALFLITAPTVLRRNSMRIEAQIKGQGTTLVAARIPLVPGPAAGLVLAPEGPHLDRNPGSPLRVFLGAQDAFGNPVDAGQASVLVNGMPSTVKADADGAPMVVVQSPTSGAAPDGVVVEAVLDGAHAVRRVPFDVPSTPTPAAPSPYLAFPRYSLTPRLGVLTNFGPLLGVTFFVDGFVHPSGRDPGLGLGLAAGIVQSHFSAESLGVVSGVDLSTLPLSAQVRQQVVSGRTFAAVGGGAGVALALARVHTYGATTVGSGLGGFAEVSVEAGVLLAKAHLVLALRYAGIFLSRFSSGDRLASNAGGAIADLGYRRVW